MPVRWHKPVPQCLTELPLVGNWAGGWWGVCVRDTGSQVSRAPTSMLHLGRLCEQAYVIMYWRACAASCCACLRQVYKELAAHTSAVAEPTDGFHCVTNWGRDPSRPGVLHGREWLSFASSGVGRCTWTSISHLLPLLSIQQRAVSTIGGRR